MLCERCERRGQTWDGEAPKCGFDAGGRFLAENWNCATLNEIRAWGEDVGAVWQDDQHYAVIPINAIGEMTDAVIAGDPLALYVTWYKHRGRTNDVWLLFSGLAPRRPTLAELQKILRYASLLGPAARRVR